MNLKSSILAIILVLIASLNSFSQEENGKQIEILNEFYKNYIYEISKMPMDFDKINQVKATYCSESLLKKLNEQELDFDPFINAQDLENDLYKKIKIKATGESENTFSVSYLDLYSKKEVKINLRMGKEGDSYKIIEISN